MVCGPSLSLNVKMYFRLTPASDTTLSIYEIQGLLRLVEFLETQSRLLVDFTNLSKEERKDIRRDIPSLKNVKQLVQTVRGHIEHLLLESALPDDGWLSDTTEMEYYDSDVDPNEIMFAGDEEESERESQSESGSDDMAFRCGDPDEPRPPKPRSRAPSQVNGQNRVNEKIKAIRIRIPQDESRRIRDKQENYKYKRDAFVVGDESESEIKEEIKERKEKKLKPPKVVPVSIIAVKPAASKLLKKTSVFNRLSKTLNRRK